MRRLVRRSFGDGALAPSLSLTTAVGFACLRQPPWRPVRWGGSRLAAVCRHQFWCMVGGCRYLCSPAVAERVQHELDAVWNAQTAVASKTAMLMDLMGN